MSIGVWDPCILIIVYFMDAQACPVMLNICLVKWLYAYMYIWRVLQLWIRSHSYTHNVQLLGNESITYIAVITCALLISVHKPSECIHKSNCQHCYKRNMYVCVYVCVYVYIVVIMTHFLVLMLLLLQ